MSTLSVGGDSQKHNGTSGVHAAAQQQQMTAMAAAVPVVAAANGRNFGHTCTSRPPAGGTRTHDLHMHIQTVCLPYPFEPCAQAAACFRSSLLKFGTLGAELSVFICPLRSEWSLNITVSASAGALQSKAAPAGDVGEEGEEWPTNGPKARLYSVLCVSKC
uniref:Transmembrane protein n=1 Tax=Globodera rostochiensis TaxID=31243 RepID=A0A914GVG0_GLORO